jgi:uncharacterized RDD family membrane protein YckC
MQNSTSPSVTPSLKRRLISMVYEAFLLLAVEMFAVLLFLLVVRLVFGASEQLSPTLQHVQKGFVFLVAAAYFIHFWTDSGHTLAMKTWRIKLVMPGHARVPPRIAAARFLLAWGWFLPAAIYCYALNVTAKGEMAIVIVIGFLAWSLTALFDKDRQFLHDRLVGTRLINLPKLVKTVSAKA